MFPAPLPSMHPEYILILRRFLLGCFHTVGGRKERPQVGGFIMYSTDDTCFDLRRVLSVLLSRKPRKCFWLGFSLGSAFARHRALWKRTDRPNVLTSQRRRCFYIWSWHGCLLGGSRQVTCLFWASQRQFSIEVGMRVTCIFCVTLGKLLNLSELR